MNNNESRTASLYVSESDRLHEIAKAEAIGWAVSTQTMIGPGQWRLNLTQPSDYILRMRAGLTA